MKAKDPFLPTVVKLYTWMGKRDGQRHGGDDDEQFSSSRVVPSYRRMKKTQAQVHTPTPTSEHSPPNGTDSPYTLSPKSLDSSE